MPNSCTRDLGPQLVQAFFEDFLIEVGNMLHSGRHRDCFSAMISEEGLAGIFRPKAAVVDLFQQIEAASHRCFEASALLVSEAWLIRTSFVFPHLVG